MSMSQGMPAAGSQSCLIAGQQNDCFKGIAHHTSPEDHPPGVSFTNQLQPIE